MGLFLRILVIVFEILYYSLFMKFARKQGNFWKYLLLFTVISIVLFFISSFNIYAYLVFMVLSLFGLKLIGKTSLYDMFIIFIMILFKLLIELLCAFPLNSLIPDINTCKIILGLIKVNTIILIGNRFNILYNKLKTYWSKNNFYIRYLFSIFMFIYIISACLFLINFR